MRRSRASYEEERRALIKSSGDGLASAKQAIFAFHRDDRREGDRLLRDARMTADRLARRFRRFPALAGEGAYRAMLEEYVEAALYAAYLSGRRIGPVAVPGMDDEAYLGGLMDMTGELVRRAVAAATRRDDAEARRCHAAVEAVAGELIRMHITGSLRPKYDQTKHNLRKLEEILYDLSKRA